MIIQPFWETLTVRVASDRLESVDGVAQLTWCDWKERVLNTSSSLSIPALNNSLIYEGTTLATILPAGYYT